MDYVKVLEIYILKTLILIIFIIDVMIYKKKNDLDDFLNDFKLTKAISILIKFSLERNNSNINEKIILTCLKIINAIIQTLTYEYDLNKENENTNNYKKNVQIVKLISDDDWNIISGEENKVNVLNDNNNNLYKNRKLPSISSSKINFKQKLHEIILKNLIKNLPKKKKSNK